MTKQFDFFFGEEPFITNEHVETAIQTYSKKDLPITTFKNEFDINELLSFAANLSLFSEQQILLIKDPSFLTKKCAPAEEKKLINFFENYHNPDMKCIVTATIALDQRKKLVTCLKKHGNTIISKSFKDWEQDKLLAWIKQRFQKNQKDIQYEALLLFESMCDNNLQHIHNKIQTLLLFIGNKTTITIKDIDALSGSKSSSFYTLGEAIKEKNTSVIIETIHTLLTANEDPIKILGYLIAQFRLYFQLVSCLNEGMTTQTFATQIKKNPFFIKQIHKSLSKTYTPSYLAAQLNAFAKMDLDIKSGAIKANETLLAWAAKL